MFLARILFFSSTISSQVLQEVTCSLPPEDRLQLTELIHCIQTSKPKRSSAKRWSGTIPQVNQRNKISPKNEMVQRYTPKEESAGIQLADSIKNKKTVSKSFNMNNLIGTCRAVRIKEDTTAFYLQESFKIKAMLHHGETFTC